MWISFWGAGHLEKEIEKYQTSLLVQDLIKLLPEPLRQVIYLCDTKEENQQEAAELLGITLDNLKVRLHRARKQLKAIMEEKGYSPSTDLPCRPL
jgi:RNA polymerase sigma factor (sigma-70 family)